jgi:hypothetical protein
VDASSAPLLSVKEARRFNAEVVVARLPVSAVL